MLKTYRARLILYTILLATFIVSTLAYTYWYARSAILEQAEANIVKTARLLTGNIEMEENELQHYIEVVRDDPRIKEYMFMVTKVGAEGDALATMYDRNFGWLPVDRYVFIDNEGHTLLGVDTPSLSKAVIGQTMLSGNKTFYFQGEKGLELVAWASISYQGVQLGTVAITHILDQSWLVSHKNYSGGHLFIVEDGVLQLSTLTPIQNTGFYPQGETIVIDDEIYRVRTIPLSGENMGTPHLWYGVSEQELLNQLERHTQIILLLTILGVLAIFITGTMIVRNFNRPLTRLMQIAQAVTQGTLPTLDKSTESNEIDTLVNRFSEMLQSLREKQAEVDQAHKRLEESAITDVLTGLNNRRYLNQVFPKLFSQAQRDEYYLCGLMLDLDHFKEINDRYGHMTGDQCLSHIAKLFDSSIRRNDYVFRIGGEEFLVLSLNDRKSAETLAEKIRRIVEQSPLSFRNKSIGVTASIGVAYADKNLSPESALTQLLSHADKALYAAKNYGRNQVVISDLKHTSPPVRGAAS